MNHWISLDPELLRIEREQCERRRAAARRHRELLDLAGYVPPGRRLRARLAVALLRLALRLDAGLGEPPTPLPSPRRA